MAESTAIEWAHHSWSPWEGCQKTGSPACEHCYAEARNARFGGGTAPNWGPHAPRRPTAEASWRKPLAWDCAAAARGVRERVFPSLCDPFDNKAPEGARVRFGRLILATPNLDWLLLTKRIGNAAAMLAEMFPKGVPANVWLGATVVTQAEADRDVPTLLATAGPRVRFLSMEPLMEAVDLRLGGPYQHVASAYWGAYHARLRGLDRPRGREVSRGWADAEMTLRHHPDLSEAGAGIRWIIVGGESGRGARPMHPDWARGLRDQCAAAGVPFFFKQWGEWIIRGQAAPGLIASRDLDPLYLDEGTAGPFFRVGKALAGRLLDGVQHDGAPA